MRLFSLFGEQSDVEIKDGKLVVWCNDDNYLQFSEPETEELLVRGLKAVGSNLTPVIDKRKRIDFDARIDKLKSMMGGVDLDIKKK